VPDASFRNYQSAYSLRWVLGGSVVVTKSQDRAAPPARQIPQTLSANFRAVFTPSTVLATQFVIGQALSYVIRVVRALHTRPWRRSCEPRRFWQNLANAHAAPASSAASQFRNIL